MQRKSKKLHIWYTDITITETSAARTAVIMSIIMNTIMSMNIIMKKRRAEAAW